MENIQKIYEDEDIGKKQQMEFVVNDEADDDDDDDDVDEVNKSVTRKLSKKKFQFVMNKRLMETPRKQYAER